MGSRDLTLQPRLENVRDKLSPNIIIFSLEDIRQHFNENLDHIKQQYNVAESLIESGKIEDAENIWRSQIVFLDSALDFYLHELTKYGLLKMFEGEWRRTVKYNNLSVKIPFIEKALSAPEENEWFKEFSNEVFSNVPMMSFDAVKSQINLIGLKLSEIADNAFYCAGSDEKTQDKLKRRIKELYDRRNLIAHQSDRKAHNAERESISREMVESFVKDVEKIVDAIHNNALQK